MSINTLTRSFLMCNAENIQVNRFNCYSAFFIQKRFSVKTLLIYTGNHLNLPGVSPVYARSRQFWCKFSRSRVKLRSRFPQAEYLLQPESHGCICAISQKKDPDKQSYRSCPVRLAQFAPSEVIHSKSKGQAHFPCGRRSLSPAECRKEPATFQLRNP